MKLDSYRDLILYEDFGAYTLLEFFGTEHPLAPVNTYLSELIARAEEFGWRGNLWQHLLTYLLVAHENPFSLACERTAIDPNCSLARLARKDLDRIGQWFSLNQEQLDDLLGTPIAQLLLDYEPSGKIAHRGAAGTRIAALCKRLSESSDTDALYTALTDYYRDHGVGMFGLDCAFSVTADGSRATIEPIAKPAAVTLDDIIGYEQQKQELVQNTEAFARGRAANNVLLYGDSGTGKSTAIKAMLNEFSHMGVRLIEINKYQFRALSSVISQIKERRYRFIVCIDDLSFEENESEYKFLKAVIEGGVETNPENVLIYATSNRRHLIRETWNDRSDMEHNDDIHRSDTIEEKLSLASRFGVTINYSSPDRDEYLNIVKTLARREGIEKDEEQLCFEATRWELRHGGISCRTARQFIDYLHSKN